MAQPNQTPRGHMSEVPPPIVSPPPPPPTPPPPSPLPQQSTGAQKLAAYSASASALAAVATLVVAGLTYRMNSDYQHKQLRAYVVVLSATLQSDNAGEEP